jgi:hypothetical protein
MRSVTDDCASNESCRPMDSSPPGTTVSITRPMRHIPFLSLRAGCSLPAAEEFIAETQADGPGPVHRDRFVVLREIRKQLRPRVG